MAGILWYLYPHSLLYCSLTHVLAARLWNSSINMSTWTARRWMSAFVLTLCYSWISRRCMLSHDSGVKHLTETVSRHTQVARTTRVIFCFGLRYAWPTTACQCEVFLYPPPPLPPSSWFSYNHSWLLCSPFGLQRLSQLDTGIDTLQWICCCYRLGVPGFA